MAHGYLLESEYESGYIHRENEQDVSPYGPGRNFFYDILHSIPTEHGHGRMVRFSMIGPEMRYDIDWTLLPEDATPIHYMEMQRSIVMLGGGMDGDSGPICLKHVFGFSYKDPETGEEITEVEEVGMQPEGAGV